MCIEQEVVSSRNCIKPEACTEAQYTIVKFKSLVFQAEQPEPVEKMVQRHTPRKKAEEKVLYDFLSSIAFACSCSAILVTSPSASLHATTLYLQIQSYHLRNCDGKRPSLLQANTQPTGNLRHCRYQQMLHGCCVLNLECPRMQTTCAERQKL